LTPERGLFYINPSGPLPRGRGSPADVSADLRGDPGSGIRDPGGPSGTGVPGAPGSLGLPEGVPLPWRGSPARPRGSGVPDTGRGGFYINPSRRGPAVPRGPGSRRGREGPPPEVPGDRPGPARQNSPFSGNPRRGVTGGPPREVDVKGGPGTPDFRKIGLLGSSRDPGTSKGAKISILTEIPFDFTFLKSCWFQSKSGKMRVNTHIWPILAIFDQKSPFWRFSGF